MANAHNVSQPRALALIVEKDVKIPTRDGAVLHADVLRPGVGSERVPAIMNIGPYQKDRLWIPSEDLEEKANPYLAWETGNPLWWCPRGYALVRVDARGSGRSAGQSDPSSYAEAVDFYGAIEWIARQPWCSGNIGTLGVSYHANCQWRVANLNPPSLKAIIPWEGRADRYRDQAFHGGILAAGFLVNWIATNMAHNVIGRARSCNPNAFNNNMLWTWANNNLDSEFWRARSAQWERIKVPMYSVGIWTAVGLHLRGNVEGFMLAASRHKKLRIHSGTHFHPFHSEEGRIDQLLRRHGSLRHVAQHRTGRQGRLGRRAAGRRRPHSGHQGLAARFAPQARPGALVALSTYHAHDERLWLEPGEAVECRVEIWPTCMVFGKGHRIQLDVQPRDGVGASAYRHYHADYNIGARNTVHAGGDKASYLLLPFIAPKNAG